MVTLATTSLSSAEQRAVDRFVAALEAELGDELLGVWLFGSRARGEPARTRGSDVDLLVITRTGAEKRRVRELADEVALDYRLLRLEPMVRDPAWVAERRAVDAFLLREIDADRVVVYGSDGGEFGERVPFRRRGDGQVSERTAEYLRDGRSCITAAKAALDVGEQNRAINEAYFAMFELARAALSEEDLSARKHRGTWHLHHQAFVKTGRFPADLHQRARDTETQRVSVDYESGRYSSSEGREAVELAERFLTATLELLS
jgi:uncharacterized protein (UPF0332 family)/predicted nucleotidyltransferase